MDPVGAGVHRDPPADPRVSAGGPVIPWRRHGARGVVSTRIAGAARITAPPCPFVHAADDGPALPFCPCFGIGRDGRDGFGPAGAEPMVNDVPANG